jgi:hypothetical protein
MTISKREIFIIGIAIILCARIFDFSFVFVIIGIILIYDALININRQNIEDKDDLS